MRHEDYANAVRRLTDAAREAEQIRESLAYLRNDLQDDDADGTHGARFAIRAASENLGAALAALDNAVTDLPTPLAR